MRANHLSPGVTLQNQGVHLASVHDAFVLCPPVHLRPPLRSLPSSAFSSREGRCTYNYKCKGVDHDGNYERMYVYIYM